METNFKYHLNYPREVFKKRKREKENNCSRNSEELESGQVADATLPVGPGPEVPGQQGISPLSLGKEKDTSGAHQVEEDIIPPARSITSRRFAGITAQHNRTRTGVKVSITLQPIEGEEVIAITAELKRANRLRELRDYEDDSPEFAELIDEVKDNIRAGVWDRDTTVLGRCHERGVRASWIPDVFVVGILEDEIIQGIILFIEDETHQIAFDQPLSERQRKGYHSGGMIGRLNKFKKPKNLFELPRRKI